MKEANGHPAAPVGGSVPATLLMSLRVVLDERRTSLRRRLGLLEEEMPHEVVDGPRGLGDAEMVRAQFETTRAHLVEVDAALARIDDGTYGACVGCDGPIAVERLEALPETALCVGCTGR